MKRSSLGRNRGFTLIEVLLVLVILVVLASLAVVNIIAAQHNANVRAAKVQVELFDTLLQHYQLDVGDYPSTASGLNALRYAPSDLQNPNSWQGPYSDKDIPLDPWGRQYQYTHDGPHNGSYKPDVWTVDPQNNNLQIGNWTAN
jgi:general secretion pathway protein G